MQPILRLTLRASYDDIIDSQFQVDDSWLICFFFAVYLLVTLYYSRPKLSDVCKIPVGGRESRHYGARLTVGETDDLKDEVTLISTDSHHEETAIREQAVNLVTSTFGKEKGQLLTESEALDLNSVYLCA